MRNFDAKRYAPLILVVALVVTPLAIWAATSGGSKKNDDPLLVERSVGLQGEPELLLSLTAKDVEVTNASSSVQVECKNATGKVIITSSQPWPFVSEPGYNLPHIHQAAESNEIEQARTCAVLGTNKKLEAQVK
jgi:hypothetical protein